MPPEPFESLALFYSELNAVSSVLSEMYGDWWPCFRPNCASCCSQSIFLVSELEATYLLEAFNELPRRQKQEIRAKARTNVSAMRRKSGYVGWARLVQECKAEKSTCALLSDEGTCLLYEHRPSTCRAFGMWIFDSDQGVYACPIVTNAIQEHRDEGVKLPNFKFVAKRQEEVLRGRVMPLSAWLED